LTEENKQETYAKLLDSVKDVEKENEILHGKLLVQEKTLNNQSELITKLRKMQKRICDDLELSPSTYRNETTRSVAFDAFNQSTVEAHFAGLGEHPIIKNIYLGIEAKSNEQEKRAEDILKRFENQPNAREFIEQLKNSWFYTEFKEEMTTLDNTIKYYRKELTNATVHGNQQDLKIRDQIADIDHAMNALEFLGSEREIKYNSAFMFLIGAWARSGYEPVAEGLRFMLDKPKEPTKEIETPNGSTEEN